MPAEVETPVNNSNKVQAVTISGTSTNPTKCFYNISLATICQYPSQWQGQINGFPAYIHYRYGMLTIVVSDSPAKDPRVDPKPMLCLTHYISSDKLDGWLDRRLMYKHLLEVFRYKEGGFPEKFKAGGHPLKPTSV